MKDTVLNKNKLTGNSNDFGIVQCYSPEDAEYLLRVTTSSDFLLMGNSLTATLSKLTREGFYELYGNIQATESLQEQNYQQQQYLQAYYKSFFDHLANSGYYYDADANEYRKLEDRNSFEKVALDTVPVVEKKDVKSLIEFSLSSPTDHQGLDNIGQENFQKKIPQEEFFELNTDNVTSNDHIEPKKDAMRTDSYSRHQEIQVKPLIQPIIQQSNQNKVYCGICRREFNSEPHLAFHKRHSALHKKHILESM